MILPIREVLSEDQVRIAYGAMGLRPIRNAHIDGRKGASPGAALALARGLPWDALAHVLDGIDPEAVLAWGLQVDRGALIAFLAGWDGDAPEDAQPEADEHRDAYEHGLALGVALLGERAR